MGLLENLFVGRRTRVTHAGASRSRDWRECTFWVIDLELTGLDPRRDHIVSYGAVPIRGGRFRPGDALYGLVASPVPIPGPATRIHNLRDQDLADAPSLGECVTMLDAALHDGILVGHCVDIERAFLSRAFRSEGKTFNPPVIDTAEMVRPILPQRMQDLRRPSLEAVAQALDLPVHEPHHALGDALTTATVFLAAAGRMEREHGSLSLSHLLASGDARVVG